MTAQFANISGLIHSTSKALAAFRTVLLFIWTFALLFLLLFFFFSSPDFEMWYELRFNLSLPSHFGTWELVYGVRIPLGFLLWDCQSRWDCLIRSALLLFYDGIGYGGMILVFSDDDDTFYCRYSIMSLLMILLFLTCIVHEITRQGFTWPKMAL